MANTPSALKRYRQSLKRRDRNRAAKSRVRTAIKKVRAAIAEGDAASAKDLLQPTLSLLDATAGKGILHRNAAARTKSRLTRQVAALGA